MEHKSTWFKAMAEAWRNMDKLKATSEVGWFIDRLILASALCTTFLAQLIWTTEDYRDGIRFLGFPPVVQWLNFAVIIWLLYRVWRRVRRTERALVLAKQKLDEYKSS